MFQSFTRDVPLEPVPVSDIVSDIVVGDIIIGDVISEKANVSIGAGVSSSIVLVEIPRNLDIATSFAIGLDVSHCLVGYFYSTSIYTAGSVLNPVSLNFGGGCFIPANSTIVSDGTFKSTYRDTLTAVAQSDSLLKDPYYQYFYILPAGISSISGYVRAHSKEFKTYQPLK